MYALGYGTPLLFVIGLVAKSCVDQEDHYIRFSSDDIATLCWIDTDSIIWFFIAPIATSLISNMVIVVMVLKVASTYSLQTR